MSTSTSHSESNLSAQRKEYNYKGLHIKVANSKENYVTRRAPKFTYSSSIYLIFDNAKQNSLKYKKYKLNVYDLNWNVSSKYMENYIQQIIGNFDTRITGNNWTCCSPQNNDERLLPFREFNNCSNIFHDVNTQTKKEYKRISISYSYPIKDDSGNQVQEVKYAITLHINRTRKTKEQTQKEIKNLLKELFDRQLFKVEITMAEKVDLNNLSDGNMFVVKNYVETYNKIYS